jgi:hypothetical protein
MAALETLQCRPKPKYRSNEDVTIWRTLESCNAEPFRSPGTIGPRIAAIGSLVLPRARGGPSSLAHPHERSSIFGKRVRLPQRSVRITEARTGPFSCLAGPLTKFGGILSCGTVPQWQWQSKDHRISFDNEETIRIPSGHVVIQRPAFLAQLGSELFLCHRGFSMVLQRQKVRENGLECPLPGTF